ncbi:MAG: hypothetical protein ORN85_06285, partial [Sediminibacterium sp.]|nr:hypothetical protein [Sediminibacterium sp.]
SAGTFYYYVVITNAIGGNNCRTTSATSGAINIFGLPTIITQPNSSIAKYCINSGTPTSLTVQGSLNGIGTISYNWYSNTTASRIGGSLVSSGTTATSYSPSIAALGSTFYYVEVVNQSAPNGSICKSITSNISGAINVYNSPSISIQISSSTFTICQGNAIPQLFIAANNGGFGTLSYTWYINTSNSFFGANILNGIEDSFYQPLAPPQNDGIARYYFVVVRNGGPQACDSVRTNRSGAITFNQIPTIDSSRIAATSYCQNANNQQPLAIFAKSNNANELSHKWTVRNTPAGNITILNGEILSNLIPATAVVGVYYYQDSISNGICTIASPLSGAIRINALPVINTQPVNSLPIGCYKGGTFNNNLSVNANDAQGGNNVTYTWFRSLFNNTSVGININQSMNPITPIDSLIGTNYYFVVVANNTPDGNRCTITSSVSGPVNIYAAPTISLNANSTAKYCYTLGELAPTAFSVVTSNSGLGTINTTWYINKTNQTSNGDSVGNGNQWFPRLDSIGRNFYYARVRNLDAPAACNTTFSATVTSPIDIYRPSTALAPTSPNNSYCIGQSGDISPVSVVATNGGLGTLTYQWYINSVNSNLNGTAITLNGTNPTYIPLTSNIGSNYYYVVVKNGSGLAACDSVLSPVSNAIIINGAPRILTQSSTFTTTSSYCQGSSIPSLDITADNGLGGTNGLGFLWFVSRTAGVRGDTLRNVTISSYTPSSDTLGGRYYQIIVYNGNCSTSLQSNLIQVNLSPTISQQIDTVDYAVCLNGAWPNGDIFVSAQDVDGGSDLNYSWYSNSIRSTNGGTALVNSFGNDPNFTPLSNSGGISYYFVIVSNLSPGNTCTITSRASGAYRVYTQPTITQQPSNLLQRYCLGSPGSVGTALTVTPNIGLGVASVQWRRNAVNGAVVGTGNSYQPRTDTVSSLVYFAIIRNIDPNFVCPVNAVTSSSSGSIIVYGTPTISIQPSSIDTNYCLNQSGLRPLSVTGTAGGVGTLTYQWFSNPSQSYIGSNRIKVNGSSQTYTPPSSSTGSTYFYVVIKNQATPGSGCDSIVSNISGSVNINVLPTFLTSNALFDNGGSYCQVDIIPTLSITASDGSGGSPSYQWYNSKTAGGNGTILTGEISSSYSPSSDSVGTNFYRVVLTNGFNCTASRTSGSIISNRSPRIVSQFSSITSYSYCFRGANTFTNLSLNALDANNGPSLTYSWYRNNLQQITGGVLQSSTSNVITPTDTVAGTSYYFVILTNNSGGGNTCRTTSLISGPVNIYTTPTINSQTTPTASYCRTNPGVTGSTALSINYSIGILGNVQTLWYRNALNTNLGGDSISFSTNISNSSYSPRTDTSFTSYYYVVVRNTSAPAACNAATSLISGAINVYGKPTITNPSTVAQNYCQNQAGGVTSLNVSGNTGGLG